MKSNPRVDLHCHSTFSDGALEPEVLVDRLASASVTFAALTDHDSIDGLERFRAAAARRGLVAINGVELTAQYQGREIHLLGYGFVIDDAFKSAILSFRQQRLTAMGRNGAVQSIEANLLQSSYNPAGESQLPPIQQAIDLIHKAGGKAFLAHPLLFEKAPARLVGLLAELKKLDLDGIEAIYGNFPTAIENTYAISRVIWACWSRPGWINTRADPTVCSESPCPRTFGANSESPFFLKSPPLLMRRPRAGGFAFDSSPSISSSPRSWRWRFSSSRYSACFCRISKKP